MSDHHHDDEHKEHGSHGGGGHGGGGHGGGGHEEHEGAPEWLISFADNVTLMMGFFVIMLAAMMAQVGGGGPGDGKGKGQPGTNGPDMLDAAIAVRAAFNNPVSIDSLDPNDQPLVRRLIEREDGQSAYPGPKGKEHDVQTLNRGDKAGLCGKVPFDNGSSELSTDAKTAIAEVVREARGLRMILEIRGHASASESFGEADKGMRLSFDRALVVAKALAKSGFDWRQLRVVACSDNDRLQPRGYGKSGQKKNERVEIMITPELMPNYSPDASH